MYTLLSSFGYFWLGVDQTEVKPWLWYPSLLVKQAASVRRWALALVSDD